MPRLDSLGFTERNLAVVYRASEEPQALEVMLATQGKPEVPFAPLAIQQFVMLANAGALGGSEFSPLIGKAEVTEGPDDPTDDDPESHCTFAWTLSVQGVCPLAIRTLVESLRRAGDKHEVSSLSIAGMLPPDGTKLSVREDQVRSWLENATAYPGGWAEVPFPIVFRASSGCRVRAEIVGGTTPEILAAFEDTLCTWSIAVMDMIDRQHKQRGRMSRDVRIGRTRADVSANFPEFTYERTAARHALLNTLTAFHKRVAPIAELTIGM